MEGAVVLPAAGLARRLGGIPKFLLPSRDGSSLLTRHIEAARPASAVIVVTRPELREFVIEHVGEGVVVSTVQSATMSETIHHAIAAHPDIERFVVGLPDTAVDPMVRYPTLLEGLNDSRIVVAAYPTRLDQRGRLGALRLDGDRCLEVRDKDPSTVDWEWHWGAIGFHRATFLACSEPDDPHVGFALARHLQAGGEASVVERGEEYFDLGTVEELKRYLGGSR